LNKKKRSQSLLTVFAGMLKLVDYGRGGLIMYGWTVDEALKWAETWRMIGDEMPTGDQMALDALANEVLTLRSRERFEEHNENEK
jgi:hypothetical protein